jgi:hypothetical protein
MKRILLPERWRGAAIVAAAVLDPAEIPLLSLWMLTAYADSLLNHRKEEESHEMDHSRARQS